jgi:nucleoside-diphosphate-sugar epimerase
MRVFVTGGTGSVGREILARLADRPHSLRVIGRQDDLVLEGAEYHRCDITDSAALKDAMRGSDAVIHLAALATPMHGPDEELFRQNCQGSYNVYQAASELGIGRVVSASSINAFGFHYGVKGFPIQYLPIDEDHPTLTTDPYSFSKQVLEQIAEYFYRRDGISGCCLRLPWVANATPELIQWMSGDLAAGAAVVRDWIRLSPEEGRRRALEVVATAQRIRAGRMQEHPATRAPISALPHVSISTSYTNLFTQLDARDSAQAFEKALFGSYEGSHALFVNDSVNRYLVDSRELARLFYPEAQVRAPLTGAATLVSIDRARHLLGFEPAHTVDRLGVHAAAG